MHEMNLRFEGIANTAQIANLNSAHGLSSVNQNDSSFRRSLEAAQKELEKVPEKPKIQETAKNTTEGNKATEKDSPSEKTQDIKEKDGALKDSDTENESLAKGEETLSEEKLSSAVNLKTECTVEKEKTENIQLSELERFVGKSEIQPDDKDSVETIEISAKSALDAEITKAVKVNLKTQASEKTEKSHSKTDVQGKITDEDLLLYAVMNGISAEEVQKQFENGELQIEDVLENKQKASISETSGKKTVFQIDDQRSSVSQNTKTEEFVTKIEKTSENEVELSMNLSGKSGQIEFEGVATRNEQTGNAARFSQMLSQQLSSNAADFVKAGNLVLRDNNKGTINLVLHPEDLGNVKISLEMTDKVVAGKIVVATKEAYDAFNQNINTLRDAFNESGFEGASFELSWSGENSKQNEENNKNVYGKIYDDNIPEIADSEENEFDRFQDYYGRPSLLNMVV